MTFLPHSPDVCPIHYFIFSHSNMLFCCIHSLGDSTSCAGPRPVPFRDASSLVSAVAKFSTSTMYYFGIFDVCFLSTEMVSTYNNCWLMLLWIMHRALAAKVFCRTCWSRIVSWYHQTVKNWWFLHCFVFTPPILTAKTLSTFLCFLMRTHLVPLQSHFLRPNIWTDTLFSNTCGINQCLRSPSFMFLSRNYNQRHNWVMWRKASPDKVPKIK